MENTQWKVNANKLIGFLMAKQVVVYFGVLNVQLIKICISFLWRMRQLFFFFFEKWICFWRSTEFGENRSVCTTKNNWLNSSRSRIQGVISELYNWKSNGTSTAQTEPPIVNDACTMYVQQGMLSALSECRSNVYTLRCIMSLRLHQQRLC